MVIKLDVLDLSYILVSKRIVNVNTERKNKVCYVFDLKSFRVENTNYIILDKVSENIDWLNIGGTYILKKGRLSVDVRLRGERDYSILKDAIRRTFTGETYAYWDKDVYDVEYSGSVENVGVFLRKCVDSVGILDEGQYVYLNDTGESGYVIWKNGNDVYVFLGRGQYMLSKPILIQDLSGQLKGMYRFVVDVEWQVIQRQK